MGIQIAQQTIESGIMTAKSVMMQLEMQVGMTVASIDSISKALQPVEIQEAINIDTSAAEIDNYIFDVDQQKAQEAFYVDPSPPGGQSKKLKLTVTQEMIDTFDAFAVQINSAKDLITTYKEAKKKLEDLEKAKKDLEKEVKEKLEEVEKIMKEVYQSPYLLPGLWASMVPSILPFGGGLIPPPFFGGPPSTVPGMIYIALLLIDAIEEKVHDDLQKLGEENCEEQL